MEARIIQIGNSRGVRIPKTMLEQAGMTDRVELSAKGGCITITAASTVPRSDWKAKFESLGGKAVLSEEDSEWLDADLDVSVADAW
jgi:antitoxin MazE